MTTKNFLSKIRGLFSASQSTDVGYDCRLTVVRPSFDCRSTVLKLCSILVTVLTVGVGNAWGAGTTVTYTLTAKTTVSKSGTAPTGATATVTSTGSWYTSGSDGRKNTDQMTAGKNTVLTLSGFKGYKITGIVLNMCSNSSNGKGTFSAVAGSTTIASISSATNFNAWYDNTSYGTSRRDVNVSLTNSTYEIKKDEDVVITIACVTTNSLYISSWSITYEAVGGCSNSVAVTKGSESHGSITTIATSPVATCSATAADRRITITITPDDCYDAPTNLSWTKSSGTVTASKQSGPTDNGDGTYSYVYQFAQNDNGAGTFGVTCTAKAAGKTVNFDAGPGVSASSSLTETCDGSGVTLPAVTASGVCKGWTTFAGWATAAVSDSTTTSVTVYSAGSKYTPASNNMTLYAVYSKTKGGGSGFKLSLNSGGTDYYVGAKGSGSYMSAVTDAADAVVFTFANGYLSYDNSGTKTYISSAGNNTTLTVGTSVPSSTWTESGTTTYTYQSSATGNRYLGFNSGTSPVRFAPYGSTYAHEFTKHSLSTTYYCSDPNCCTQLGSINGSVNLTTDGCGAGELKATWKMLATTGIASQTLRVYDENLEEVTAKRITGITASTSNQTKTISGLNPCKEYYVTVENVSSGGEYCAPGDPWESDVVTTLGYTYTITKNNVSLKGGESEAARACEDFMAEYVANTGYALPTTISVSGASAYEWEDGVLSIEKANVTGNVSVTISGTCVSPVVTGDPADASYYVGDSPDALSVSATLASGTLTYLWKVSTNGGSTWSDATGTNNAATYSGASLSTASVGTLKFKCIVGNSEGGCTVESGVATITVSNASYFPNGKTIFIQAHSTSAWTGGGCVKAWFHTAGGSETAQSTYWLFDATDGDAGKKLFATVVPATGDLPYLDIQRFAANCSDWWNKNGGCSYSDANGSNAIRSTGKNDDASDGNYVFWNGSGVTLDLHGDPSGDDWASSLASFSDQGSGEWTATYNNYAPANAAGESQDFKVKTNYNGWIGNKEDNDHQNENATLDGMHVGSTYNITATLNVISHALTMSKTFVKGTVHFDLQGHGLAISDLTNVTAGSKISAPSAPSATGYDFGGWYKEPACTNAWNFGSDVVNETMTLYAKWTAHEYTITKTLTNVTSSPVIPSTYTYTGAAAGLTYTISANDGYRLPTSITVSGTTYTWNSATGALTLTGTITSNVSITITAVQTHKVDWYVGGSAPANKIGDDGQTTVVDHGGKISDFPAHDPDGSACDKVFVGWTDDTDYDHGTSSLFNDVAGSPQIDADAQFYAVFAEVNSVSASLTKMTADDDLEVGDKIVIIAQDTRYGMYQASASSYVSYWTTTDVDGEPSLSEIEADDKKYLDVAAGSASNTWKLGDATNGYLYNASSTNLEFSTTNSSDLTLITWTDDSFTFVAGQEVSCRTDITGANANKWRGAGASCDPETGDDCSGTPYYYLYKYVPGGTTATGHTINCASCSNEVTVSFSAPGSGNTMTVAKGVTSLSSGDAVKTCSAVALTVTLTPASHYTLTGFTATGLTTGTATITPAVGSTLPVSVAQTFTVTVSAGATGTLTLAPTFTAQTPLSITLETHSKGTFTPIGDIYSGESFTFPTVTPSDAECSSFLGWIEGTTFVDDGTETDPTAITGLANYHAAGSSSGTLTTNKTYTAVYGEKDTQVVPAYQKVTSAPSNWSGDYLIVRDDNSRAFDGSLSTLDAADNYIGVTISDGSITANSTVNASKWTIAKVGETSNYTIKSASGYYIGRTANSNGLNSSTSEEYTNTLAYSTDHVDITSSAGPKLQMNGGARFRYYGTSQQVLQLYKYNPDAEVVAYTYCTNPACTPRYRVTMNSATGGSPSADKVYEHADETITLTANPSSGYSFTSWTITKTTGGDNVTSTLLTGDKPTTANTTFTMPAYDITIAATYTKKMVSTLEVKDGATVVSTTTGPVSGTVNISTGANKTLDVVITPSDAYDHSWTATVSAGSTYASITNLTDDGFRVNGLAQGDATITVNAPNDGSAKSVTLTVQVRDIMPEEIILKRDGSNTPIETLIMYYDETNSKGQYVKVNVGYSPANPTNKAFTFSSALTGKVGSHSHAPASGYEVLVANGVTSDAVNCTFTSSADGSVTKVLAVTVLPILSDRFVDYVHGNATQTVSARLSDDRYSIIPDINTPSLSDASDANPTSEDCETSHYHLVGWLPQTTAEALWAAGTPITDATEGLVRAGESVEATGQTWCAIWAEEQ